jgi:hypothetical protein
LINEIEYYLKVVKLLFSSFTCGDAETENVQRNRSCEIIVQDLGGGTVMRDFSGNNGEQRTSDSEGDQQNGSVERSLKNDIVLSALVTELAGIATVWLEADKRNLRIRRKDYDEQICELLSKLGTQDVGLVREAFRNSKSSKK